jgi:hypothetical protein
MIWQDLVILAAQIVMLVGLWPTLRDKRRWPHPTTAVATGIALAAMALALGSLALWLSTTMVVCQSIAWLWMASGRQGGVPIEKARAG